MPGPVPVALVALALLLPSSASAQGRTTGAAGDPLGPNERRLEAPAPTDADDLASDPRWLALLHQSRKRLDGRARRTLHESGFFLSAEGEPAEELEATLAALRDPDAERARAVRCDFPARHDLLAEHGLVDAERGPCPALDEWREQIGEFELTLIFPESFLGNPASMFGHTLLRFDSLSERTGAPSEALLGWALDYTADAEGDMGALYMMRGLLGGYEGRFAIAAYYEKTRVYSDWQDRDIWEYPLAMSEAERERLLLHVWELRDATFPYYFFTHNCSEKILELLEVAWPELGRGAGFPPAVIPVDTLRAISESGHPLGTPELRVSPATRLQKVMADMSRAHSRLADALAEGKILPEDPRLGELSDADRARVLEVAYDLLRHRFLARKIDDESSRQLSRALLVARSRIPLPSTTDAPTTAAEGQDDLASTPGTLPIKSPPDAGHGTARVELAGGFQARDGFLELRVQPAYHELLDSPLGFAEGGQIRVLDTRLRIFPKQERVRLHELVVLDVVTASPWRRPFHPLGWRFDLGLRTRLIDDDDSDLDAEEVFRFQGGIGAGAAPIRQLLVYGFGELALEAGAGIEGDVALGPVARSGISWSTAGGRASLQLEGIAGLLTGPKTSEWLRAELSQRTSLGEKWALVLSGRYERAYDADHLEGRLGLTRYF